MADQERDIFATGNINVPNLVALVNRLRNERVRRAITILHVHSPEEGDWICNTAAAKLKREQNAKMIGPDPGRVIDLVEQAIRLKVPFLFAGELRRDEDARALRAAATLGVHTASYIVRETRSEANNLITMLGSWASFDVALLSEYP
jgi:hypothetical protein